MKRITIIANCQTGPIAQTIALNSRGILTDGIALDSWFHPENEAKIKYQKLLEAATSGNEIVYSFNVGDQFEGLATRKLKQALGDNLTTFTNIRFDGLHPDCVYLGRFGGRWPNFLSEYHSKIVAYSFISGRSEADCLRLFNGKNYEVLGYYDVFRKSEEELLRRDEECNIKFASTFISSVREEYSLLTINHPTSFVFHHLSKAICNHADVPFADFDSRLHPNPLVQNVIWPIYNEVAEAHNLTYRTPQYWTNPPNGWYENPSRTISREEFIHHSYEFYKNRLNADEMRAAFVEIDPSNIFESLS